MTRYILIREAGADVTLLVDKLTMSVSEVAMPPEGAAAKAKMPSASPRRFEGIEAAVALADAPQISARMYYHDRSVGALA